jgi:hypothetical protein
MPFSLLFLAVMLGPPFKHLSSFLGRICEGALTRTWVSVYGTSHYHSGLMGITNQSEHRFGVRQTD